MKSQPSTSAKCWTTKRRNSPVRPADPDVHTTPGVGTLSGTLFRPSRRARADVTRLAHDCTVPYGFYHRVGYGISRRGAKRMRLPDAAHTSRPWRIHELTPDFPVAAVWAPAPPGGPGDFPLLVRKFFSEDASRDDSRAARVLWAIRWKLGQLLGWDGPDAGLGSRVPTLRDRLPEDLRDAPSGPDLRGLPFTPLYLLGD